MALFNFGKKKKKKRKRLLALAAADARQVSQKKSQMTAALKQRTEFVALRYWAQAVNPAANSMKTHKRQ